MPLQTLSDEELEELKAEVVSDIVGKLAGEASCGRWRVLGHAQQHGRVLACQQGRDAPS